MTVFDIIDDLTELIYVSDIHTYELLYMNAAGRSRFQIEDCRGKKCYEVLQGRNTPCPFCTTPLLTAGETHTWEFTNEVLHRHFLLKDRLLDWEGTKARLEIAFDITDKEEQRLRLEAALAAENAVMECVQELYTTKDLDQGMNRVLKKVGTFLDADRVYVFDIQGERMSNTFEWCAPDIVPQISALQDMDIHLIDNWLPTFSRHECYIIPDLEEIRITEPEGYAILAAQGIYGLVAAPLERDGKLTGYLGVDNPSAEKVRNIEPLFETLRYFVMSALRMAEDEKKLTKLSFYDTLTGAYNRNRYMQDMKVISRSGQSVGIVFLDVNGLKDVNDRQGHICGDQLLIRCAQEAAEIFKGAGELYRIGGDEYILLCSEIEEAPFQQLVKRLEARFLEPGDCSAAVGSCWSPNAEQVYQLASTADTRMYENKRQYYNKAVFTTRYRYFENGGTGMQSPATLERLLAERRFVVHFQPKLAFRDGRLVGAEALVRYQLEDGSLAEPGAFLPDMEDSGLIERLDFYVFETVCQQIARWKAMESHRVVPVSVNLSRVALRDTEIGQKLRHICDNYGVETSWLEVEVAENANNEKGCDLGAVIRGLRQEGFLVSMDDFGIQFANLSLLVSLDYDKLKVDKSLVTNLAHNRKAHAALKALAALCRESHTRTVVEGIETAEQFDILKAMGFDEVQGFLISRPLSPEAFERAYLAIDPHFVE